MIERISQGLAHLMTSKTDYIKTLLRTEGGPEFEAFIRKPATQAVIEAFELNVKDLWLCIGLPSESWGRLNGETVRVHPMVLPSFDEAPPHLSVKVDDQPDVANAIQAQAPANEDNGTIPPSRQVQPASAPQPVPPTPAATDTQPSKVQPSAGQKTPNPRAPKSVQAPAKPEVPVPNIALRLPNAMQGTQYNHAVHVTPEHARLSIFDIECPEGSGLSFDADTQSVHGIPANHGDLSLHVVYRFGIDPPDKKRRAIVALYVNPDPRSLWKDIPSDPNTPFWKEDNTSQGLSHGGRKVVASRRRGRSHANVGTCCDDDFSIRICGSFLTAVVADGAGSADFSRLGSKLAVAKASEFLSRVLEGEPGASLIAAAEKYLDSNCENDKPLRLALYHSVGHAAHVAMKSIIDAQATNAELIPDLRSLSTTLLAGFAVPVRDQWLCAAYWVGDGAAGVYRRGNEIHLLGEPDAGEFSGQTRFLSPNEVTSNALDARTKFAIVPDFTGFVLMTDGVSDPLFETEARLQQIDAWDDFWDKLDADGKLDGAPEEVAQKLVEYLNFHSPGNHDDRTIALIY